ncbi:septal ring factor EnvC (AmiA/AmiB activator) [Paenibacillus sp. DS2015]|uniref:hypothetical protein n=1 Tax=Paenibacillus sp. DS2015 TaxID=3373917 RepID=UPI003D23AD39
MGDLENEIVIEDEVVDEVEASELNDPIADARDEIAAAEEEEEEAEEADADEAEDEEDDEEETEEEESL